MRERKAGIGRRCLVGGAASCEESGARVGDVNAGPPQEDRIGDPRMKRLEQDTGGMIDAYVSSDETDVHGLP